MATAQQLRKLAISITRGDQQSSRMILREIAIHAEGTGLRRLATDLEQILNEPVYDKAERLKVNRTGITQFDEAPPFCVSVPTTPSEIQVFTASSSTSEQLERVILENKNLNVLAHNDLSPMRRLLLVGPPGTGKSMSARVLAEHLNLKLYRVSGAAIFSRYLGESAKNLASLFAHIAEHRAIYLFDEFDSFAGGRQSNTDIAEMSRFTNELLQLIEVDHSNSLIIATTNLAQSIDGAFSRRFDTVIEYTLPSLVEIKRLISQYLPSVSLKSAPKYFVGLSQAEIVTVLLDLKKQLVLGLITKLTLPVIRKAVELRKSQSGIVRYGSYQAYKEQQ